MKTKPYQSARWINRFDLVVIGVMAIFRQLRNARLPLLAAGVLQCGIAIAEPHYQWQNVTNSAAFVPRDGAGALVYDGKMWLLGGWNPSDKTNFPKITNNEVWSTTNGANWTLVKPNTFKDGVYNPATDWEGRHTAGYAVHNNKLWIVGGDANQGHYQNDVWNSTDGANWTHVNQGNPVPWGPRVLHYTLEFNNKIWVMGGQTVPQIAPAGEAFYRDIWNSADGITWQQVQPQEPFWPQRGMIGGAAVMNGRMWILGGGTYDTPQTPARTFLNDVWSSADGIQWTQHTVNAPWAPRQYHDVAVFDDKLWVMEGYNGTNRNDVWYSADGANWTQVPNTPWAPRHAASVYVHDNALWMVTGNNLRSDVWKLTRSVVGGASHGSFESPTFANGSVVGQDDWINFYFSGAGIEVVNTSAISGNQSLRMTGGTRVAASRIVDNLPTDLSWLVRVDDNGGGSFEAGIGGDPATGRTPITLIFGADHVLKFFGPGGDTPLAGSPTYDAGVVYRVEMSIDQTAGTWDVSIIDTGSNSVVGAGAGLPILPGLNDPRFFVISRGGPNASVYVDDISLLGTSQMGDFDGDGDVDGADFVVWQTHFPTSTGATLATGDADGDGDVDGADFVVWQTHFPTMPDAATAVPEPSAMWIASGAVLPIWASFWFFDRQRATRR